MVVQNLQKYKQDKSYGALKIVYSTNQNLDLAKIENI